MNKKNTKRALLASTLSLLLCVSMLVGTTFAWFTDTVTSGSNIIKSGKLDVEMYWTDGDNDPATASWADASRVAIFDYDLWEPGYVSARHLKIENVGNLAFKYQMRILANGIVSELADVIDVYYFEEAKVLSRGDLTDAAKLGTLSQVLNNTYANAVSAKIIGQLEGGKSKTITLALKMQESAGNEYQNLSIGSDFSVQMLATQLVSEYDSFNNTYDSGADFAPQEEPSAMVSKLIGDELDITIQGGEPLSLDAGFQFEPTETPEQGAASKYANWHADFYVYADQNVAANTLWLAGYYDFYCQGWNDGNWIGLPAVDVPANVGIRLIADGMNDGDTEGGITVPYNAICALGNDGIGFRCGIADVNNANAGTKVTVELRLYETLSEEECLEQFGYVSANKETGHFITVGKFTQILGGARETLADGTVLFYPDDGGVVLYSAKDVASTDYTMPEGVTEVDGFFLAGNTDVKNVTFASTVEKIGYKAFKDSSVESVDLNEGLTVIDEYAFNAAKKLKNFTIPSSVTTLEQYAFSQTAATEVVIPENVETIGYAAFTAMPNLTTVTIEGENVAISNYAFRNCVNLRTVNILSDDITIGNNMPFTNAQSNNPNTNNITFNVKNTTVADKIVAAMGTGSDFYINVATGETYGTVSDQTELKAAVANGTDVVILSAGTYDLNGCQKTGVVLKGVGAVKLANTTDYAGNGKLGGIVWQMTIEDLTITDTVYTQNGGGLSTFNNVTFAKGVRRAYGSGVTFNGCTFGKNSEGYALHFESDSGSAGGVITLNGCKFQGGNVHLGSKRSYEFTNCDFATGTDFQVWSDISLENCTVNGVLVTEDNIATLFPNLNLAKVTLK